MDWPTFAPTSNTRGLLSGRNLAISLNGSPPIPPSTRAMLYPILRRSLRTIRVPENIDEHDTILPFEVDSQQRVYRVLPKGERATASVAWAQFFGSRS